MVKGKKNKKKDKGESLDDAFADDEDIKYAESKPAKKLSKEILKKAVNEEVEKLKIKATKPISKLKKGDKIKVDGKEYEVDAHYVLIDHGTTKEMAIDVFDKKANKDYELRYFNDQTETSIEFYRLDEIVYNKINIEKVEW